MSVLLNLTGTTTSRSPTVSGLSSMTGLRPGEPITGAGIPSSTTILSLGTNSLILSNNATATGSGVALQATLTGFTQLIANNIESAAGVPLAAGELQIDPTDTSDVPLGATSGGVGGGAILPACVPIVNGSIGAAVWVPDSALTRPANLCYRITIVDASGEPLFTFKTVQPSGASLNLDTYVPNVAPQAVITAGPAGPPGPVGAPALASGITLVDTADGSHWLVTMDNGQLTWAPV